MNEPSEEVEAAAAAGFAANGPARVYAEGYDAGLRAAAAVRDKNTTPDLTARLAEALRERAEVAHSEMRFHHGDWLECTNNFCAATAALLGEYDRSTQ